MPDRYQVALAVRYRDALIDLRRRVAARVRANWDGLGSWDEADVARFLDVTLPQVAAAQRRTVSLTDAYLARAVGGRVRGLPVDDLIGAAVRNGADPAAVYTRPFVQLWSGLSDGQQFADALNAAGARVEGTAATDVTLSMRSSAQAFDESGPARGESDIIGWERVLDPEACAYCATASTQRYHSANLEPIHNFCNCGIAPVFADTDQAIRNFNDEMLGNIKDAHGDRKGPYWTDRHFKVDGQTGEVVLPEVTVHEHGELGAVMSDASHSFTGPADVAA